MEVLSGSRGVASHVLKLGTLWDLVLNFMPWLLYAPQKNFQLLKWMLCGNSLDALWQLCSLQGIEHKIAEPVT
jgi:hypothetical protein